MTRLDSEEKRQIEKCFYDFEFIQMLLGLCFARSKLKENWEELDLQGSGSISLVDLFLSLKAYYPGSTLGWSLLAFFEDL